MKMRMATIDDVELLVKLRIDFLIDAKGGLTDDEITVLKAQAKAYFTKHIGSDFIAVLAECDNTVVSCAYLVICEKPANPSFITGITATLLNVYTYPQYRRKGYVTNVIKELITKAKELNVSYIDLKATDAGRPVYQKLGFTKCTDKDTPMILNLI